MPPFKCPTPCHKFTIATESFRITTEGFHVGVGGGLALRVLRSNILTFNFGDGPEGFEFEFGTGWMF
jgi:hypothetical protein